MKIEDYLKLYENQTHQEHVKNLCLKISEISKEFLNHSDDFIKLLEAAAILHDIGHYNEVENHALQGFNFILKNGIENFTPEETKIIALLVKYHPAKTPKKASDELYASLPKPEREIFKRLLGILRLADGLDCSHNGEINIKNASFDEKNQILTFFLTGKIKNLKEILIKKNYFERVFKIQVLFIFAE